jgi:hypothetical protein
MLSSLEEDRLRCSELKTTPLTATQYNILMISERVKDDSLRPNLASYSTLMKAFILRRQLGFALEVNDIWTS